MAPGFVFCSFVAPMTSQKKIKPRLEALLNFDAFREVGDREIFGLAGSRSPAKALVSSASHRLPPPGHQTGTLPKWIIKKFCGLPALLGG